MKKAMLVGAGAFGLALTSASAHATVITASTPQSGAVLIVGSPAPYPLTGPEWDFGADALLISDISAITISAKIFDGDTGPSEFDEDDLTLALDGIETGLVLNGFLNELSTVLTLSTLSPLDAAAILAALQSDGRLVGTILDSDGSDQYLEFPSTYEAVLTLEGPAAVPEPGTLMLLGGGLASLALRRRRQS